MIPLTLADVANTVGGRLADADPDAIVGTVTTDSRQSVVDGLFLAVRGTIHDGHDHCAAALAAGNICCLVSRPVAGPHIRVADTVVSAGRLARRVIDDCPDLAVVAITGSSGKTSTKDLLRVALSAFGPTVAPQGSFNNELGLPRTVFEVDRQTRFLVAEMGARGPEHIAYLCGIAPPAVGMVLNVGSAHIGEFGSRDVIAAAKGEIVEALAAGGTAVLFADDPLVAAMADRTAARVLTFGRRPDADVRIADLALDGHGRPVLELDCGGEVATLRPQVFGEHQGVNVAAAAAAGVALGLPFRDVAAALDGARLASGQRMDVRESAGGVTVIDDSYNANPESMAAGLRALAAIGRGRRTWAVLGEMRELGGQSAVEHDAIGRLAVRLNISKLVVVGEEAKPIHMGAAHEGSWGDETVAVADPEEAIALLAAQVRPGDVVLVKASRAVGLDVVATAIIEAQP